MTTSRGGTELGGALLPFVLSATAGAVDVILFLALGGLFTAHITGNVVVLAAHYVTGAFSEVGPLLAVPVFVTVLGAVTVAYMTVASADHPSPRGLLMLQAALLTVCLGFGVGFGPFADADRPLPVFVGMLAVAAMATQNALVKLALPGAPSTAVMTTNITQLTIDLATLARRLGKPDDLAGARRRVRVILPCIVGFVVGCAAGAGLEVSFGLRALALPVAFAVLAVAVAEREASRVPRSRQIAVGGQQLDDRADPVPARCDEPRSRHDHGDKRDGRSSPATAVDESNRR